MEANVICNWHIYLKAIIHWDEFIKKPPMIDIWAGIDKEEREKKHLLRWLYPPIKLEPKITDRYIGMYATNTQKS